jgi:hypothetical protein
MAKVKAGSLAKYRNPTQDDSSPDRVGIVLETSTNEFEDGHSEEWVMIAPLTGVIHRTAKDVVPLDEDVVPPTEAPVDSSATKASVLVPSVTGNVPEPAQEPKA